MKTEDEFFSDSETSVNEVTDVPEAFKEWVRNNEDRILAARERDTEAYFLRDNKELVDGILQQSAKYGTFGEKHGSRPTQKQKKALQEHKELHDYSIEQIQNFDDITKATGFKRGKPMTFDEADHGMANMCRDSFNCASCVLVHELRLRGYNVTALPYGSRASKMLSADTRLAWMTPKTNKKPEFTAFIGGKEDELITKIENATKSLGGRYHLAWDITEKEGHIVTMVRTSKGLVIYDPQKNRFYQLADIVKMVVPGSKMELLRVDRLLFREELLSSFVEAVT